MSKLKELQEKRGKLYEELKALLGKEGETFTVKGLNNDQPYTIGKDSVVILGPPFVFNKDNIDKYVAEFGF